MKDSKTRKRPLRIRHFGLSYAKMASPKNNGHRASPACCLTVERSARHAVSVHRPFSSRPLRYVRPSHSARQTFLLRKNQEGETVKSRAGAHAPGRERFLAAAAARRGAHGGAAAAVAGTERALAGRQDRALSARAHNFSVHTRKCKGENGWTTRASGRHRARACAV